MSCVDIEELAGAFALGAVAADEAEEILAHLAQCPDAHRLVGELIEVADVLPLGCDEREPPPRLRENLLTVALAEPVSPADPTHLAAAAGGAQAAVFDAVAGAESSPRPLALRRPRPRGSWINSGMWAAAAALLLIAIGLGVWNIDLHRGLDSRSATEQQRQQVLAAVAGGARVVPMTGQNGIQATLVEPRDGRAAYVIGNMPRLPADKAYQAWVIRDGQPLAAGVFRSSGVSVMTLSQTVAGAQAVAFTIEAKHGSETPTLPIVAQGPVS